MSEHSQQSETSGREERIVPMRLQKFLARAGVASRRGSENLMTAGRVTVNGVVVSQLGSKVDPLVDTVAVDGKEVHLGTGPVTIMLHKPSGYVTTMSDPFGRPTVAQLVPTQEYPGLYPIGRLDADTTGLLLFSTDGELGNGLLHPSHHVSKTYYALVEGKPTEGDLERLRQGVLLDDGMTAPAEAEVLVGLKANFALQLLNASVQKPTEQAGSAEYRRVMQERAKQRSVVQVTVHEGKKRQVKRMLAAVGHPVVQLHRSSFGPLVLDVAALPQGAWRELSADEVSALRAAIA